MKQYNVAVVGTNDLVGEEMITILEQRDFPVQELRLLATEGQAGARVSYKGKELLVQKLTESALKDIDIAIFASQANVSQQFIPPAVEAGAIAIDTTSAFRLDPNVPLIVPEVNPHTVASHQGILASPGCSTIQLAVALRPIHTITRLKRIVVSTYQAVSETGKEAIEELDKQVRSIFNHRDVVCQVYPHQIAFNCLPHLAAFQDNGYSAEETNLIHETQKVFDSEDLRITATAVRVPVFYGNSLSVNIETEKKISPEEVSYYLEDAPGIKVIDEPENNLYPLAVEAVGEDEVCVGRIREDESIENGINMWIVTDNLRKGAAVNAVQIAEVLIWNG
jgi:aspartate-semialdehyde dehydrogenase